MPRSFQPPSREHRPSPYIQQERPPRLRRLPSRIDDSEEILFRKRNLSRRFWTLLLGLIYLIWTVFQFYTAWLALVCPNEGFHQWAWPLALMQTSPCVYYALQFGFTKRFSKALLSAVGLYPLVLCIKSLYNSKDSRKFQEAQCMYGAMAVIPSLAVYGSILVSVDSPYSNNGFRYYSLPGPLGDWSAEWMQYRVDDAAIQEEKSLRTASIYGLLLSGLLAGVLLVRSEMDKLVTCRERPSAIGQILSLIYYWCSTCSRTTLTVLFLSAGPSRKVAPWNGYSVMISMAITVVLCAFSFSRSRSQSGVAISGAMALGCWWTSWRAMNAFDAEEWDASRSLLEFLSQIWGWENVIAMAVCYLTDPSNALVVLCCLGGFVIERGLRELLDFTRSYDDEVAVGQRQQQQSSVTEALLSA